MERKNAFAQGKSQITEWSFYSILLYSVLLGEMSEADGLQKEIFGQNQTHNLFKDQIRNSQNKLQMECKRPWPFADVWISTARLPAPWTQLLSVGIWMML